MDRDKFEGRGKAADRRKTKDKGSPTSGNSSPSHTSDSSLSLSPTLLPEDNKHAGADLEQHSRTSSISEHISSINSVENDRSLHEVEISNILQQHSDLINISQENRPSLNSYSDTLNSYNSSAGKYARSILDEILYDKLRSESGRQKSDSCNSLEASLNIFDGINLDDNSINDYARISSDDVLDLGDKVDAANEKGKLIEAETARSDQSNFSMNTTTVTEYKCQEEYANRIVEFENAVSIRDRQIMELSQTLNVSIEREQKLLEACEGYSNEVEILHKELASVKDFVQNHRCDTKPAQFDFQEVCSKLEEILTPPQILIFEEVKIGLNNCLQAKIKEEKNQQENEIKILRDKLENEKAEHGGELNKLRELLANVRSGNADVEKIKEELTVKFEKEMEQLRIYYEKKCADVEKNYSEEIFSQQSRKLSGCSTGSEPELASDLIYAGGDAGKEIALTRGDLFTLQKQLDRVSDAFKKYEFDTITGKEHEEIRDEVGKLMEILRVDSEGRLKAYEEKLEVLKWELAEAHKAVNNVSVQEAMSAENGFEDIIKSYESRLEEQVALAKNDFIASVIQQIQMLCNNPCDDSAWPEQFYQIRNCFTEKYEAEIAALKEAHSEEITKLKEDHHKTLHGALERARRRSLRDSESFADIEVIRERDSLKKASTTQKKLITNILDYINQCEDELNNTLVEELVKNSDEELNESLTKRVHLTPDRTTLLEGSYDENNLKNELETCLERLRVEANAVLASTMVKQDSNKQENASMEERMNSLKRRLITDSKIKKDLGEDLIEARELVDRLQSERFSLERKLDEAVDENKALQMELGKARDKIVELVECGRKEVVSEGYGENEKLGTQGTVSRVGFAELHERARSLAAKLSTDSRDSPLLQLVEDLFREGERIVEEAKRQREDFLQQIEVADRKLKETTQFLDEQAAEREQERDEAHSTIEDLRTQLRDREKDKAGYERIQIEEGAMVADMNACCERVHGEVLATVEQLEMQMREMSRLIESGEQGRTAVERERRDAVEKISELRDIIRDLESQLEIKTKSEIEIVTKYQEVVRQQRETNDELAAAFESASANHQQQVEHLEEEIRKIQITNELAGNQSVLKQIQLQLHEVELNLDKSTRDLESVHHTGSSTTCSSPSEEMSVRDQLRPQTPNSTADDCDIPLQQLARLKEKLIKHSRAEQAAVKRIQDLEMQLVATRHDQDELQNDKALLQDQLAEQLVLISSLQIRLDDQRIRAETNQKQNNSALEMRIYELENELQTLKEHMRTKEGVIKQLKKTVEETRKRLQDREDELEAINKNDDVLNEMRRLQAENDMLLTKIASDAQNTQILPGLVGDIIADKNRDINNLRGKLSETEKQLDLYVTLNMDKDRLGRSDERLSYVDQMRKSESKCASLEVSEEFKSRFEPEISSIERIGPPNINYTTEAPLPKPNSTEIQKRVHFDISEVAENSKLIEVEANLEKEKEAVKDLRIELAEAKMHLTEAQKDNGFLKEDGVRKDEMYFKLAKEKKEMEKVLSGLELELEEMNKAMAEKEEGLKQLENLKEKEGAYSSQIDDLKAEKVKMGEKIDNLQEKVKELECEKANIEGLLKDLGMERQTLLEDLRKISSDFEELVRDKEDLEKQFAEAKKGFESKNNEIKGLKDLLYDRECELEILNEDITTYQNDLAKYENDEKTNEVQLKLMKQRKEVAQKDLEIVKLKTAISDLQNEIVHLQDYLNEKDKIIHQMETDSESLKVNLETIREKMAEAGNVYELREKLQQEKEINANLRAELGNDAASIEDIEEQVQKQLNYSAHLDNSILDALNSSADYNQLEDLEQLRHLISSERHSKNELQERFEEQIKILEAKLDSTTNQIRDLQATLDAERNQAAQVQIEDANLIEQMRLKLEAAIENETEFAEIMAAEQKKRQHLEQELLKKENLSSTSSKTEYKSLPDGLQELREENQRLRKDLKYLKKCKGEAESGLKYTKDLLNLKCKEVEKLENDLEKLQQDVIKAKEDYVGVKVELDQRNREVENSRTLLDEMEQENLDLKLQSQKLREKIQALIDEKQLRVEAESQRAADMSSPVSDKFLQKMKDLGDLVSTHMKENKVMAETLNKLTLERTQLQQRVAELEDQNNIKVPFDDPVGRANHLFGKYLRADSYRKALVYQKKYLVNLLITYQDYNFRLPYEPKHPKKTTKTRGIERFRSASYAVIAIIRMQFLVRRWHSGSRSGAYLSLQRKFRATQRDATYFHIGQPVSSQNFSTSRLDGTQFCRMMEPTRPRTPPPQVEVLASPWSGYTPPSKESSKPLPSTSNAMEFAALRSPDLTQYVERFNVIQQRLGLTLDGHNA